MWGSAELGCVSPRCFLLGEIEKEEKEKVWYYAQLQSLSKRLEELPHVETVSGDLQGAGGGGPAPPHLTRPCAPSPLQFSMQMDLIRQQLQFEAQHIRALMEERFGTADEMVQRAQVGDLAPLLPSGPFPTSQPCPAPPALCNPHRHASSHPAGCILAASPRAHPPLRHFALSFLQPSRAHPCNPPAAAAR